MPTRYGSLEAARQTRNQAKQAKQAKQTANGNRQEREEMKRKEPPLPACLRSNPEDGGFEMRIMSEADAILEEAVAYQRQCAEEIKQAKKTKTEGQSERVDAAKRDLKSTFFHDTVKFKTHDRFKRVVINIHFFVTIEHPDNVPGILHQILKPYPKLKREEPNVVILEQCKRCIPHIVLEYPHAPMWTLPNCLPNLEQRIYKDAYKDALDTTWNMPLIIDEWKVNPRHNPADEMDRVHSFLVEILYGSLDHATRINLEPGKEWYWPESAYYKELFGSLYFAIVSEAYLSLFLNKKGDLVGAETKRHLEDMDKDEWISTRKFNLLNSCFSDLVVASHLPACNYLRPNFNYIEQRVKALQHNKAIEASK